MIGTLVTVFLVIQCSQANVTNITIPTSTTISEGTTLKSKEHGDHDDTEEIVKNIETLKMLPLIQIPKWKNYNVTIRNHTVADGTLVQYLSECQHVVVALKQSYVDILKGHAEWTARWYEVHFPDYYACVTRNLNRLMRDSLAEYPRKVIMKIRTVKDAILRSYITNKPISTIDPELFEGLNAFLEGMDRVLTLHRDGGKLNQGDGLEAILESQIRRHQELVRVRCNVPISDANSVAREEQFTDYLGDEDYEPIDYFVV